MSQTSGAAEHGGARAGEQPHPTQQPTYSIKREFDGATVMITGASGYIGSLLVEQLLRTTRVARVYVLVRGKRGTSAQERVAQLLGSGLFHMVRDDPALTSKVALLEGDMNSDELGLSPADLARVRSEVQFVVHAAASIELEADVQKTLGANYLGTRRLLELARSMRQLRSFVHVSTAYVNVNQPRGASVHEAIYPLALGPQPVEHAEVVEDLMSLPAATANMRAQMWMDMWRYPNTYTMGKALTERLVASYARGDGGGAQLPVAIVRPSLVCGLAGAPYPGFCGNLAGPMSMGIAIAVGLFDSLESVAMVPTHVWDAVPGDVVSSTILAAAAATAAKVDVDVVRGAGIGRADDPLIVHAGTSTTYPISFIEFFYLLLTFVSANPPPFRIPGGSLFTMPLDYKPDEAAVERCKRWTAWRVWGAVKLLELLGQHKTARRLKVGHRAWEVQNSAKTDMNLLFGSANLRRLEALLDAGDAASGDFTVTWTLRNGGWPRYIRTGLVGVYRCVFGMSKFKGLDEAEHDFRFVPAKALPVAACAAASKDEPAELRRTVPIAVFCDATAAAAGGAPPFGAPTAAALGKPPLMPCMRSMDDRRGGSDLLASALKGAAATFETIPASGARRHAYRVDRSSGGAGSDSGDDDTGGAARGAKGFSASGGGRGAAAPGLTSDNVGGMRGAITAALASALHGAPAPVKQD